MFCCYTEIVTVCILFTSDNVASSIISYLGRFSPFSKIGTVHIFLSLNKI